MMQRSLQHELILLVNIMLCGQLHCRKVLKSKLFSYQILKGKWASPDSGAGRDLDVEEGQAHPCLPHPRRVRPGLTTLEFDHWSNLTNHTKRQ